MGTTLTDGPEQQPVLSERAAARPNSLEHRRELRCCRCGEPWSEEAPPCCADPVDDYLTVTRTRRTGGRVLESVIGHDGKVIAAVWVSDEKVARPEEGSAGIHRDGQTTFKGPPGLSGRPDVELDEYASLDPWPPVGRSTDIGERL